LKLLTTLGASITGGCVALVLAALVATTPVQAYAASPAAAATATH